MPESTPTSEDWYWMRMAVDLGKESDEEPFRANPSPRVGVVIVKDGQLQGEGFRGKTGSGEHAEYGLLELLDELDLEGATVFTTLEPCSRRNHPKRPCATHLIDRGVGTVFIGMYDPNPRIYREGWRLLSEAGVRLRDFPPELRNEIWADNERFLDQFRIRTASTGTAIFDYLQNSGRFDVVDGDRGTQGGRDGGRGVSTPLTTKTTSPSLDTLANSRILTILRPWISPTTRLESVRTR